MIYPFQAFYVGYDQVKKTPKKLTLPKKHFFGVLIWVSFSICRKCSMIEKPGPSKSLAPSQLHRNLLDPSVDWTRQKQERVPSEMEIFRGGKTFINHHCWQDLQFCQKTATTKKGQNTFQLELLTRGLGLGGTSPLNKYFNISSSDFLLQKGKVDMKTKLQSAVYRKSAVCGIPTHLLTHLSFKIQSDCQTIFLS